MQTRQKILNFIRSNEPATAHKMLESVDIKRPMLHRHLKKLLDAGEIIKNGTPPKVFYHLGGLNSDYVPDVLQKYIDRKPYLHWWVKDQKKLSLPSVVSAILNYGDFSDVQFLIKTLGTEKVKIIFNELLNKRNDFRSSTIHFFTLYFNARRSTIS